MTVSGLFIAISLFLYCFSTSCPHNIGIVEIGIAMSLSISVISTLFKNIVRFNSSHIKKHDIKVILSVIILLLFPIISAISFGNRNISPWDISRDILPFMFFIIPIFYIGMDFKEAKNMVKIIPLFITIVGIVYSLRFIVYIHDNFGPILSFLIGQNTMYVSGEIGRSSMLSNDYLCLPFDPSVFFSAFYLLLKGFHNLFKGKGLIRINGISLLILSILPISSLAIISSRVAFGLLALLFIVSILKFYSKRSIVILCVFIGFGLTILWPFVSLVFDLLMAKQMAVGFNNKLVEIEKVYDTLAHEGAICVITGLGWGGEFYDPAVGKVASFTHSLISYFFLKSGIIGLFLLTVYMWWLIKMIFNIPKNYLNIYGSAEYSVYGIIIISLFFQPVYKTPTYGILLLYALSAYNAYKYSFSRIHQNKTLLYLLPSY